MIALVLLPLSTCGGCYAYQSWWWAGAEQAVRETVTATATGRPPLGVVAQVRGGSAFQPALDFHQPYEIRGADNVPAGMSLGDLLSPGIWVAHLHFAEGHAYHAEAWRDGGRWVVSLEPAEGQ